MAKFYIYIGILITLIFISQQLYAQNKPAQIVIGTVDTLYSNILKEKRAAWVYVPESNDAQKRYPVLYLLDAEEHFHSTVGICKQLSGVLPEMIVVGITNTIRDRDLTPTLPPGVSKEEETSSGGGANFMGFVEKELMPHIDSAYPTAPYRLFSGHSLGGLTVVNTFIHNTGLFNAYIALDPSLWWDNEKLVTDAVQVAKQQQFNNRWLFVGIANTFGIDTARIQKDTNGMTKLTRAVLKFVHVFNNNAASNKLHWDYKFYPTERHGTVELIGEYDALHYIFNYYHFSTLPFTLNPNLDADSAITEHFKKVSAMLGYTVPPPEDYINQLAYTCMENNKMEQAYRLFKHNIDVYPKSSNAFDSIGDYYDTVGDTKKAMKSYAKSLSLQETADTRRKYELMRAKK